MMNRTILNFSRINCAPVNGAQYLARKGGGISPFPEGLIARYACYDKTNEDEDRDVLKDLSGNGHDIQLYNFAFSKDSGYGAYHLNYTTDISSLTSVGVQKGVARNVTPYSFEYKPSLIDNNNNLGYGVYISTNGNIQMRLYCEGISDDNPVYIVPYNRTIEQQGFKIKLQNGINYLHISYLDSSYPYFTIVSENIGYKSFVSFKTIPNYKGALVSDGVDDYGLCENFPILDRDRGYTIISIRKWIDIGNKQSIFLSNCLSWMNTGNLGAFVFERFSTSTKYFFNWGVNNKVHFDEKIIVHSTSINYNSSNPLKKGDNAGQNILYVLGDKGISQYANIALYSLEIYDRDLTDEEIAKVKARMIAEYEAKTGEKYVEYLKLDQGKLDINKLK